uniref:Uncharacterized protein n=1 Tax=Romanomermis culicivorax TaxID=13658 RepID=A0A915IX32_ROMCU
MKQTLPFIINYSKILQITIGDVTIVDHYPRFHSVVSGVKRNASDISRAFGWSIGTDGAMQMQRSFRSSIFSDMAAGTAPSMTVLSLDIEQMERLCTTIAT